MMWDPHASSYESPHGLPSLRGPRGALERAFRQGAPTGFFVSLQMQSLQYSGR